MRIPRSLDKRSSAHCTSRAANSLPPWLRALRDSGLENQIEQLRITPEYLSTEEMSKFWTATLAHYRPSAAYQVSVVLIQAEDPKPAPLPVLVRNVGVRPDLEPSVPTLAAVSRADKQTVVELGVPVTLEGFALDGVPQTAVLTNDRFQIDETLDAPGGATKLELTIPAARAADFPAGVYRVSARIQKSGEPAPRATNELAFTLAPTISGLPMTVARVAGTASFTLNFTPAARIGQSVRLVLGALEVAPEPFTTDTTSLSFVIPEAPVGNNLARLRLDGIDSTLIDTAASPPRFLDRRIQIT